MERQRNTLTFVWLIWGVLLIILLVILSYQSAVFGDDTEAAWKWFLPNILPTLMLVSGVAVQQRVAGQKGAAASSMIFLWALVFSIIYLLLLSTAVVSVLFVTDPLKILAKSNYWLAPVQGLAASFLGVFFTRGDKND